MNFDSITNGRYILRDGEPVPEPDLMKWARWFETENRIVAQTVVGPLRVSTVFLALNHNFFGDGPPILWETMIFAGHHRFVTNDEPLKDYQERYASRIDAEAGHARAVALVRRSLNG